MAKNWFMEVMIDLQYNTVEKPKVWSKCYLIDG